MLITSQRNYADFETEMTSSDIRHYHSLDWKEGLAINAIRVKEAGGRTVIIFFSDEEKGPGFLASMQIGCVLVLKELTA